MSSVYFNPVYDLPTSQWDPTRVTKFEISAPQKTAKWNKKQLLFNLISKQNKMINGVQSILPSSEHDTITRGGSRSKRSSRGQKTTKPKRRRSSSKSKKSTKKSKKSNNGKRNKKSSRKSSKR